MNKIGKNFVMKKTLFACAFAAISMSVAAHSPFTAPSAYVVSGDNTSIVAGFAESPFDSEVAIRGFELYVVNPKGEQKNLELMNTASLSSANVNSSIDGTYQIVGKRSAEIKYAKVGKRWLRVLDAKGTNVPPLDVRSFVLPEELTTKHETFKVQRVDELLSYFSKHQTSEIPRDQTKQGLSVEYSAHPNSIKVGQPFNLTVKLNQKIAAGYQVQLEQQQTSLADKKEPLKLKTNTQGQVELPFNEKGQYIITISSPEQNENIKPHANTYRTILSVYVGH